MSFYEKYELLALLRDEGYKVFVARELATSRAVEAYLFVGGKSPLSETIVGKIHRLEPANKIYILDVGEHEGTPYVVTEVLPGRVGLRQWPTIQAFRSG